MAGALGLLTGLGLGALNGAAQEKLQQKHQSDAAWHDFITTSIQQHPEVANTPEGQKQIAAIYGKEHAPLVTGFLQMANTARQKAAQDYQQNVIGGGAAPTAGGPPAAGGQPDTPESLRSLAQRAEQHLADPQYANIYSKEQLAAGTAHIKDLRDRANKLEARAEQEKLKNTETPYQQQEAKDRETSLGIQQHRESREATKDAQEEENRKFNQSIARAKLNLAGTANGGKGITAAKLADGYQKFKNQFAQFDKSDPDRAVAIDQAWNDHLDLLAKTGADPKLLAPFYTGGAETESVGGISGALGSKKAVEKSTSAPPDGAVSQIKDASGKVTGYRMKDGSIKRLNAG